jgi:hypothetical protein
MTQRLPALSSAMDSAIRASTAAVVLAVAAIAAYISYWHAYAVVPPVRRERRNRPAGTGHDRRPGVRVLDGHLARRPAPAAGSATGRLDGSRSASPPRSPSTWPRAAPTAWPARQR